MHTKSNWHRRCGTSLPLPHRWPLRFESEKSQGLGCYATGPAVKELLLQVPDISDEGLKLVGKICDAYTHAVEDIALLEQTFLDEQSIGSEYAAEVHSTGAFVSVLDEIIGSSLFIEGLKLRRNLFTDLVKVRVGEREEILEIRGKYLVNIPYFRRLVFGGFVESGSLPASIPDDSPAAFERVLQYICMGQPTVGYYDLKIAIDSDSETLRRLALRRVVFEIMEAGWATCMSTDVCVLEKFVPADIWYGEAVAQVIAEYHDPDNPARDTDSCGWHVYGTTAKCGEARGTERKRDDGDKRERCDADGTSCWYRRKNNEVEA